MARAYSVKDISNDPPREIGILRSDEVKIGREPDFGFRLDSPAVSRLHGSFIPTRSHWFYMDLGSTNGSWLNGNPVPANIKKLIRPGDQVQLADAVVEISSLSPEAKEKGPGVEQEMSSLIVFSDNEFVDEYPIPKIGRALILGGEMGDLQFVGRTEGSKKDPSAVFEQRKDGLYVFQVEASRSVLVNGEQITKSTKIADNDRIVVDNFEIIVNTPQLFKEQSGANEGEETNAFESSKGTSPGTQGDFQVAEDSTLKTWGADEDLEKAFAEEPPMGLRRPVVSPAFGKKRQDQEPKVASSSLVGAGRKQDSLSMTSTRVLGQPSIKREVYRPRQQRYDEPEGPSLYRVLIYIFSALCFFLAIVVGYLIFQ